MEQISDIIFYDKMNNQCRLLKDPFYDGKGIMRTPGIDNCFYDMKKVLRQINEDGTVTFIDGSYTETTINIYRCDTIKFYDFRGYWVDCSCKYNKNVYALERYYYYL